MATTYDTRTKTCSRCGGKGLVGSGVVYAGVPGACFQCAGTGEVYRDAFYRATGGPGRRYYGVTTNVRYGPDNPNTGVFKSLALEEPGIVDACCDYSWVELTEEQARRFWTRYRSEAFHGVRVK